MKAFTSDKTIEESFRYVLNMPFVFIGALITTIIGTPVKGHATIAARKIPILFFTDNIFSNIIQKFVGCGDGSEI